MSSSTIHRLQVWDARQVVDYIEEPGKGYRRISAARNRLNRVPIVHIQNMPQPLSYSGLSEVEPLIALQDELNTRLSDRANRIVQAFKMIGKGIEQFTEPPVRRRRADLQPEHRFRSWRRYGPLEQAHIGISGTP